MDWDIQTILTAPENSQSLLGYYWKSRLLSALQDLFCKTPGGFSAEHTSAGLSLILVHEAC